MRSPTPRPWGQLAGNARHAAPDTVLDGNFGIEETPRNLGTIAGLQERTPELLTQRGYGDTDIAAILHGDWLHALTSKRELVA